MDIYFDMADIFLAAIQFFNTHRFWLMPVVLIGVLVLLCYVIGAAFGPEDR